MAAGRAGHWVLLAEDDDDLRRVLSECIEEGGFRVTGVATGSALWDTLRAAVEANAAPTIVIADERMPGGASGSAVLERARAFGYTQPLVLMTAFWDRDVLLRARHLGAAVLTKPVELTDLLALLSWSRRLQDVDDDHELRCSGCAVGPNVRPALPESDVMFCRECREVAEAVDGQELGVGD